MSVLSVFLIFIFVACTALGADGEVDAGMKTIRRTETFQQEPFVCDLTVRYYQVGTFFNVELVSQATRFPRSLVFEVELAGEFQNIVFPQSGDPFIIYMVFNDMTKLSKFEVTPILRCKSSGERKEAPSMTFIWSPDTQELTDEDGLVRFTGPVLVNIEDKMNCFDVKCKNLKLNERNLLIVRVSTRTRDELIHVKQFDFIGKPGSNTISIPKATLDSGVGQLAICELLFEVGLTAGVNHPFSILHARAVNPAKLKRQGISRPNVARKYKNGRKSAPQLLVLYNVENVENQSETNPTGLGRIKCRKMQVKSEYSLDGGKENKDSNLQPAFTTNKKNQDQDADNYLCSSDQDSDTEN